MYRVQLIFIDDNPYQPRVSYDKDYIEQLAVNIQAQRHAHPETLGLLQLPVGRLVSEQTGQLLALELPKPGTSDRDITPLLARNDARIQIAYGHNRMRAFKLLAEHDPHYRGLVLEVRQLDDEQMATASYDENERRAQLNAIDKAKAFGIFTEQFNWTQDRVATHFEVSRELVANTLRLLKLPKKAQQLIIKGVLSERQAQALLPLYSVPEPLMRFMEQGYGLYINGYGHTTLATFLDFIVKNDMPSNDIRDAVYQFINVHSYDVTREHFQWDEALAGADQAEGIQSASCQGCPMLFKVRKGSRCGDFACLTKKRELWTSRHLAEASTLNSIKVLSEEEKAHGRQKHWETFDQGDKREQTDRVLNRAKRCKHLRITFEESSRGGLRLPDFPLVRVFCIAPEGTSCSCRKVAAPKNAPQTLNQQMEAQRAETKKAIIAPAAEVLARALEANHDGAWLLLLSRLDNTMAVSRVMHDVATIRQAAATALLHRHVSYSLEQDPKATEDYLRKLFLMVGLAWSDRPLDQLSARHGRVLGWLQALVERPPTVEQIESYARVLVDLEASAAELVASVSDEDRDEAEMLARLITTSRERVGRILEVAREWEQEEYGQHFNLKFLVQERSDQSPFHSMCHFARLICLRFAVAYLDHKDEANKHRLMLLQKAIEERQQQPAEEPEPPLLLNQAA